MHIQTTHSLACLFSPSVKHTHTRTDARSPLGMTADESEGARRESLPLCEPHRSIGEPIIGFCSTDSDSISFDLWITSYTFSQESVYSFRWKKIWKGVFWKCHVKTCLYICVRIWGGIPNPHLFQQNMGSYYSTGMILMYSKIDPGSVRLHLLLFATKNLHSHEGGGQNDSGIQPSFICWNHTSGCFCVAVQSSFLWLSKCNQSASLER